MDPAINVPEPGQFVRVRRRHWQVRDVHPSVIEPRRGLHHKVALESMEPLAFGDKLELIWEREVHREVYDELALPRPTGENWDPYARFEAFLHAVRWSAGSLLGSLPLQSPFRGAIRLREFQLEPLLMALQMPRVNLLIADFVGAGKTIEAGLVMQEMIARQRARRILIVCPASLQRQWADEMLEKFGLEFHVVDREYVQLMRREYGVHVNPWSAHPRLVTSMDFLKRSEPLRTFRESLGGGRRGILKDWDLLVVDEVHNAAPAGRRSYVEDTDRTRMLRDVLPHFEHRLFLTATPHNGYTESFTALLEMLDPQRFSRGPVKDRKTFERHRDAVMVRRVKEEIIDDLGRRIFPERVIDPPLRVTLEGDEKQLFDELRAYAEATKERAEGDQRRKHAVRFAMAMLKKRLLSSTHAFAESIAVHETHLRPAEEADEQVMRELEKRLGDDLDDDEERRRLEEEGMAEASAFFEAAAEDHRRVGRMRELADRLRGQPDTKARVLLDWIRAHLLEGKHWGRERLVLFTEYKDTLDYLRGIFDAQGWGERLEMIWGGLPLGRRDKIKEAFQAEESTVRILLATDAASEGLNLQAHCRYLIHYEIPWNPNRMEQRNGRIDRHGQPSPEVFCHHFVYTNNEDQRFLDVVVEKVRTQRDDLGAVSEVVAREVSRAMLGETGEVRDDPERTRLQREDLRGELASVEERRELMRRQAREAREALSKARETWRLSPEAMRRVVHQALLLEGHPGLAPVAQGVLADNAFRLRSCPWRDVRSGLLDGKGRPLDLVFDPALAWGEDERMRKGIALVHLDHPVMRRALARFRAGVWSTGSEDGGLSRVSYCVVPERVTSGPHLLAFARLVATNGAGHRVHEELLCAGGAIHERDIEWRPGEELERLLVPEASHPRISTELGADLRRFHPVHERLLQKHIEKVRKERARSLRRDLGQLGKAAARDLRKCIDERIREIEARIEEVTKGPAKEHPTLFDLREREQWQEDMRYLAGRLDRLREEREGEPATARAHYEVATDAVRILPVALLYVLPATLEGILGSRDQATGPVMSTELFDMLRRLELLLREGIERRHPGEGWCRFMPEGRLEKARALQAEKRLRDWEPPLLRCLYLQDLATVARKSEEVRGCLGLLDESSKAIKRRLRALGELRDKVMHHEDLARSAEELAEVAGMRDQLVDLLDGIETALAAGEAG